LCGLHADNGKLKECIDKEVKEKQHKFIKNVHYITILRDPTIRYISEWQHVSRSMTKGFFKISAFNDSENYCNKEVSMEKCVPDLKESDTLTLEKFLDCKDNVAVNRQTRHLAEYKEKNCTLFESENKNLLLENAKQFLESLNYFALTEYEDLSLKLFEKVFQNSFKFNVLIDEKKKKAKTLTSNYMKSLNRTLIEKIDKLNNLDWLLYEYAKLLFFEKVKFYKLM
jgi:hypothetical protein